MASCFHVPAPGVARVSPVTGRVSDDTEVVLGFKEAHLEHGYGRSFADAAVHGTLDGPPDDTRDGTSDWTPDGSSVGTPPVIDHGHGMIDAMCTVGPDARCGCACVGGHDGDPILNDMHLPHDHIRPAGDGYPSEVGKREDGDEVACLPLSTVAKEAVAANSLLRWPGSFRTQNPGDMYRCITETHGYTEVRIGYDDHIPRWRKGSELSYVICTEGFPPPLSLVVEDAMKKAISMWQGIGANFKQVSRNSPATFALRYEAGKCRKGYACSFLPETGPAELLVYEKSRSKAEYLPNILAHEIGHILGLRHEFAHEKERHHPSVLFGSEDDRSVMRYYPHPRELEVSEQDLQALREFYEYDQAKYDGMPIVDFEPELHDFNEANMFRYTTRESSRRYSH